jgi:hypothetical protein
MRWEMYSHIVSDFTIRFVYRDLQSYLFVNDLMYITYNVQNSIEEYLILTQLFIFHEYSFFSIVTFSGL